MNSVVLDMAKAQLASFDYIEIKSAEHKGEVEALKEKVLALANQIEDPMAFYEKFAASGYQEEVMNLVTKISMEGMNLGGIAETEEVQSDEALFQEGREESALSGNINSNNGKSPLDKIPSVKAFLAQYEAPYETVKALGYKNRTEGAYEDLLSVAVKTDNMQDAQLIFEDEQLLWNLVAMDYLDIYETLHVATDPLYLHLHKQFGMYAKNYMNAKSDAEITYLTEKMEYPKIEMASKETSLMNILLVLGKTFESYCQNKLAIWKWESDEHVKVAIGNIESARVTMPRILAFIKEQFDLTFDNIIDTEGLKVYMQYPEYYDGLFRVKVFPHHQNFEAFRWILKNEILTDKPLAEILKSSPEKVWWPAFEGNRKEEYRKSYEGLIKEINKDILYFKYEDDAGLKTAESVQLKEDAKNWIDSVKEKV